MLEVAVHRHDGCASGSVEAGRQRDLVSEATRESEYLEARVSDMLLHGEAVGSVSAPVVDEDDLPRAFEGVEHRGQPSGERRKNRLLVS